MIRYILVALLFLAGEAQASDKHCIVGDITDTRSTAPFFSSLMVEIKLLDIILEGAEKIRATVIDAVDDTGRNIIKSNKSFFDNEFKDIDKNESGQTRIEIELKNPSRKANLIKHISGKIELYFPARDPKATVKIESFMKKIGNTLQDPILKGAGIDLTVFDESRYQDLVKNVKGQILDGIFGVTSKNSVIVRLKDPESKVIVIQFYSESGKKINPTSWISREDFLSYSFNSPMPENGTMLIMLMTDKSIQDIPFDFSNVILP